MPEMTGNSKRWNMNILLVGSAYFKDALEAEGHWCPRLNGRYGDPHLPDIISTLPWKPDVAVLTDDLGGRVFPTGLDKVDIPLIHYGVDGPINLFWQRHWSPLFDIVFSDQKQCALELEDICPAGAVWLPVAVPTARYAGKQPEKKLHDIGFVGVVDERIRPKRSRILNILKSRFDVAVAGGRKDDWTPPEKAAELYRSSKIVLNENLFPGVTTRMFEAMASGAMLLTEDPGTGLSDLFTPGRDLDYFSAEDLLEKTEYYLRHKNYREEIAASGQEKVLTGHDVKHRADALIEAIRRNDGHKNGLSGGAALREEGKALFLEAMRRPRNRGETRLNRAERLLFQSGDVGRSDGETLFYLGVIAMMKGNRTGANVRFREAAGAGELRGKIALSLVNESRAPLSADEHASLAETLLAHGHGFTPGFSKRRQDMVFWDALEHYQAALEIDPNHLSSLEGISGILGRAGAHVEAYDFLARAVRLSPERADLVHALEKAATDAYRNSLRERMVA